MLVLGLLVGAFYAAKASGEFRLRVPSAEQAVRSVIGGVLMGVGASAAGGCTVGNGMVQTSLFSYQGWVALLFIAIGIWAAAKLWLKPTDVVPGQETSPKTGQDQSSARTAQPAAEQKAMAAQLGFQTTGTLLLDRKATVAESAESVGASGDSDLKLVGDRTYKLDTLGAVCPFPLIDAKAAMADLSVGDSLQIDFDCTQATDAIPRWAATDGHEVTNFEQTTDAGWTITVKKGS